MAVGLEPLVEREAEALLNPRPSTARFASLAARSSAHDRLAALASAAASRGDLELAITRYREAYALLFKRSTLLLLIETNLKRGDLELAVAAYRKMVASESIGPSERVRLMSKLHAAVSEWNGLREVVEPSPPGLLSSEEREKRTCKLTEKARLANEARG
ncbi:MAG: hypothetical protein SGPRY_008810, partial [Prymnesium sp.]